MNILMMTNTYLPHVGGVARSVAAFSQQYRDMGHEVMIVAPEFEGMPVHEENVVRLPAIQHFNGSDFSVVLPVTGLSDKIFKTFKPDIIHSHHPFLIGSTALRVAKSHCVPHVFTHHTMYEQYTRYVPGDSKILKKFVIELATHYANLCDQVIAPSESIETILQQRHVQTPIEVIPTGVELAHYQQGSGVGFRLIMGIPEDAFVVGHVGRLAIEKNLVYLAEALANFLKKQPHAYCLIVGKGQEEASIKAIFKHLGVIDRLVMPGVLEGPILASAYQAMDVFAFASQSETQGMVLTEAMAASVPVISLDAPGAREVVRDRENGRLLYAVTAEDFANALIGFCQSSKSKLTQYRQSAFATAKAFSLKNSAIKALTLYQQLIEQGSKDHHWNDDLWSGLLPLIQAEWNVLKSYTESAAAAFDDDSIVENISTDGNHLNKHNE